MLFLRPTSMAHPQIDLCTKNTPPPLSSQAVSWQKMIGPYILEASITGTVRYNRRGTTHFSQPARTSLLETKVISVFICSAPALHVQATSCKITLVYTVRMVRASNSHECAVQSQCTWQVYNVVNVHRAESKFKPDKLVTLMCTYFHWMIIEDNISNMNLGNCQVICLYFGLEFYIVRT